MVHLKRWYDGFMKACSPLCGRSLVTASAACRKHIGERLTTGWPETICLPPACSLRVPVLIKMSDYSSIARNIYTIQWVIYRECRGLIPLFYWKICHFHDLNWQTMVNNVLASPDFLRNPVKHHSLSECPDSSMNHRGLPPLSNVHNSLDSSFVK